MKKMDERLPFLKIKYNSTSKILLDDKENPPNITKLKFRSSLIEITKSYKLESITQNFNDNYNDLINSLALKVKSPKNISKFNFNTSTKTFNSFLLTGNKQLENKIIYNKNNNFSYNINEIQNYISQYDKKVEDEKIDIQCIDNLTNREEIKDFYLYTEECLKNINKIDKPNNEVLEKMYINSFELEDEMKTKKLAIFDLDETLVHCETKNLEKAEIPLFVDIINGDEKQITINLRPHLIKSLEEIKKSYIIIVYTASHKFYADSVLDYIDPNRELFSLRLYRENCVKAKMGNEEIYVKDLRIFNKIDLKKIVIIDNSVLSFAFQIDNGIPILPFYNNKNDREMIILVNYLSHLSTVNDVRDENRKFLKMEYLLKRLNGTNEDSETEESSEPNNFDILILNKCEKLLSSHTIDQNISIDSFQTNRKKSNFSTNNSTKVLKTI